MTDYGKVEVYRREGIQSHHIGDMYFEPLHQYMDAVVGAKARLMVRFVMTKEFQNPIFAIRVEHGGTNKIIGTFTMSHTFVPVGEGDPFEIEVAISDATVFVEAPRVTPIKLDIRSETEAGIHGSYKECGISALTYRLSPIISVENVFRTNAAGTRIIDGVHGRVIAMQLERREEWSGDASEITVATVTLTPTQGQAQTIIIPTATLQAALDGDYTELIPSLLEPVELSAAEDWTIIFTIGFSADNTTSATVTISHAWANMHLSPAKQGGVAFGGFSRSTDNNPMLESAYPFYPYGGIVGLSAFPSGEQLIGTAPNGKPLYAQTFTKTGIPHANSGTVTVIATIPDIEHVVLFNGSRKRSDGYFIQIPYYYADNQFSYFSVELATGNLRFTHSDGNGSATSDIVVTVWYTKTTDQAATT